MRSGHYLRNFVLVTPVTDFLIWAFWCQNLCESDRILVFAEMIHFDEKPRGITGCHYKRRDLALVTIALHLHATFSLLNKVTVLTVVF